MTHVEYATLYVIASVVLCGALIVWITGTPTEPTRGAAPIPTGDTPPDTLRRQRDGFIVELVKVTAERDEWQRRYDDMAKRLLAYEGYGLIAGRCGRN